MPSRVPPREGFAAVDIAVLAAIGLAGALILIALLSVRGCLLGCPLTPGPLVH